MDTRTQVLIVFGAESPEHEVSIRSAKSIYDAIDNQTYDVTLCYIDKQGVWHLLDAWYDDPAAANGQELMAQFGSGNFVTRSGTVVTPNVIVPVIHGPGGEDGALAAVAQLMHIPIVGCDVVASAVCWDKLYAKQLCEANGIKVAPYRLSLAGEPYIAYDELEAAIGEPFFVKPVRAGSSVGVHKVHSRDEYEQAMNDAFRYSNAVLCEMYLPGRELEVAVLGNPPAHEASDVGEILPGEEFYSYEDKYADASTAQVLTRIEIDDETRQQLRETARRAYALLGCRGLSRVDFLMDNEGGVYLNEINTFPGFTSISQFPKLWQEQGVAYPELVDRLISLAPEK